MGSIKVIKATFIEFLSHQTQSLKSGLSGLDEVLLFETLDSTNLEAHRRRAEFADRNILLISAAQSAGKGQLGRTWESKAGLGLWMSLFLSRPDFLVHNLQHLSLYTGIVLQQAINELTGVEATLKWPNDIMLGSRKCGGVLTEIQWMGESVTSAIIGIGINLAHTPADFPDDLHSSAISLQMAGWQRPDSGQFLNHFIQLFFRELDLLDQGEAIADRWNKQAFKLNEMIYWQFNNHELSGQFLGINSQGEAQILVNGIKRNFRSGEIRLKKLF